MNEVRCEGWWEQKFYGRQPMEQLLLRFDGNRFVGSGVDIVGPFTLQGSLDNEQVAIIKQYVGRHCVNYIGTYDGEGSMYGLWRIGGWGGEWMIRIVSRGDDHAGSDIETLEPQSGDE